MPLERDPFSGLPMPTLDGAQPIAQVHLPDRPPPRAEEVALPFPPLASSRPPAAALQPPPLQVVRTQPSPGPAAEPNARLSAPLSGGRRPELIASVVVAFNQPMVALASAQDVPAAESPLALTPLPPGRFRWIDTQTLVFEPGGDSPRLPFATDYTAVVRAGTRSLSGQALAQEVRWTFATPPPALESSDPGDSTHDARPDQIIKLRFNAGMDPKAVAQAARIDGARLEAVPVQAESHPERSVWLRPLVKLALATPHALTLPADLRSVEGPLPMGAAHTLRFSTYGPLAIVKLRCGWGNEKGDCPPGAPLYVETTNGLQAQKLAQIVTLTPHVGGLHLEANGGMIIVNGDLAPSTHYQLQISGELRDDFGQKLGKPWSAPFRTAPAEPFAELDGQEQTVLDARSPHLLHLDSVNVASVRVRVSPVPPAQIATAIKSLYGGSHVAQGELRRLGGGGGALNQVVRTAIDLDAALGPSRRGAALVEVEVPALQEGRSPRRQARLVQVTGLGLTASLSDAELVVLVTSLAGAEPLEGTALRLLDESGQERASGRTDPRGIARLQGPRALGVNGPFVLSASRGGDSAFLYLDGRSDAGSWLSSYQAASPQRTDPVLTGGLWAERGVLRPGETAHFLLVARTRSLGPNGKLALLPEGAPVEWHAEDSEGKEIARGAAPLSAFGTASWELPIPATARLGSILVNAKVGPGALAATLDVQEVRAAESTVTVSFPAGPFLLGSKTIAQVSARTNFGAPLARAHATWSLVAEQAYFVPPGNPGFTFSEDDERHPLGKMVRFRGQPTPQQTGEGALDGAGKLALPIELASDFHPATFSLEVEVQDEARQSVASRASLVAHRALLYPGLRAAQSYVAPGEEIALEVVAADLDGKRQHAPVQLRLVELLWPEDPGQGPRERIEKEVARSIVTTADAAVTAKFVLPREGEYRLHASARDAAGHENTASVHLWAWARGGARPKSALLELRPDKESYAPGETARLLVQSPFAHAHGLLTVAREGFLSVTPVDLAQPIELVLREEWIPGVTVSLALVSGSPGQGNNDEPRFAAATAQLHLSRESQRVTLAIAAPAEAEPGASIDVTIHAANASGAPVAANVALALVDEGVLALTNYQTPNPLEAIYPEIEPEAGVRDLRPSLLAPRTGDQHARQHAGLAGVYSKARMASAPAMMEMPAGGAAAQFSVRSFFASVAFFDGALRTGADGIARARVKLPQGTTGYRIFAVAADRGVRAGSGEAHLRTRLPLLVRPELPRFLNYGDRFDAAAIVSNLTGAPAEVAVLARGANITIESNQQRLTLAAGEQREVRFAARAGTPGPAKIQFAVASGAHTDASEITLPVLQPATSQAFATTGVTEGAVAQKLNPPANALPGFGGLSISFASTALAGLQDPLEYLLDYPFECLEQLSSRLIGLVSMRELLPAFHLGDEAARKARVAKVLAQMLQQQQPDGGFSFWRESDRSSPAATGWAVFALLLAGQAGEAVDHQALQRALSFLQTRPQAPRDEREKLEWSLEARTLAVLALAQAKEAPPDELSRLFAQKADLPLFARAQLLEAMTRTDANDARTAVLLRDLHDAAVETAGAVHFAEATTEAARLLFHSSDRTDAIVLRALLASQSPDPLLDKLTRGLLATRLRGRWSTTQANAWALLALNDYYLRFETTTPKFDAGAWLGETALAAGHFEGRELKVARADVPLSALGAGSLIVGKEGAGRLYYRLALHTASADLHSKADERGFAIKRSYTDESGAPLPRRNGAWVAKAGSTVRVKLDLIAPDRRTYAAVVDPLPAGFEAVNLTLATSARQRLASEAPDPAPFHWWRWRVWSHEELRDDRLQIFADSMPAGVYDYSYAARATTIGHFVVPPAHAEEMYAPETFGQSDSDEMIVE